LRRIRSPRLTRRIGILEYPDWHRITVCDVPGLIEGAHQNSASATVSAHIER